MAYLDREWSELPLDLLDQIITKFSQFTDYLRFGAVCKHWNHVYMESKLHLNQNFHILKLSRNKLPMMMIQTYENSNYTRNLFSVAEGTTYKFQLPMTYEYGFFGCSRGWLFTIDNNTIITLINSFNGGSISLPRLLPWRNRDISSEDDGYYVKGILSSDPYLNPDNYEVLILYGSFIHELAYYKFSKKSWIFIGLASDLFDVIFYKDNVYAVNHDKELLMIEIYRHKKIAASEFLIDVEDIYLVESIEGHLLMVTKSRVNPRIYDVSHSQTFEIKVFKLEIPSGNESGKWVQVDNIGEQALFVSDNSSASISTLEFPNFLPNNIYFTNQYYFRGNPFGNYFDLGVFSLNDKRFYFRNILDPFQNHVFPPMWFVPTLREIKNV